MAVFADSWCTANGKPKSVAMLTDVKSDYSQGLAKVFTRQVHRRSAARSSARRATRTATAISARSSPPSRPRIPSLIFVPGYYTDIGQIAIQARDLGITAAARSAATAGNRRS